MIAYDETLITTNFQVESIIDLRDMRGQSSQNSLKHQSIRFEARIFVYPTIQNFVSEGFAGC